MTMFFKARPQDTEMLNALKERNHHPRLALAQVGFVFSDAKPFKNNRLSWGKVAKFSKFSQLWQEVRYDFCILLSMDVWTDVLGKDQQEPLLDLHLTCCDVEYLPETQMVNGKKDVIKDQWGRVKYTDQVKVDGDGNPKFKISPLDLEVFAQNIGRYGLWCEQFESLKETIKNAKSS